MFDKLATPPIYVLNHLYSIPVQKKTVSEVLNTRYFPYSHFDRQAKGESYSPQLPTPLATLLTVYILCRNVMAPK